MSAIYVCDGCGKREQGTRLGDKPYDWFERSDDDGTQHACNRNCVRLIAEKTGKTGLILPL